MTSSFRFNTSCTAALIISGLACFFISISAVAQFHEPGIHDTLHQSGSHYSPDMAHQKDGYDILMRILKGDNFVRRDTMAKRPGKIYVSAIPAAGYTLITGFAVLVAANAAFYTSDEENQNVSSILTEPAYTQYKQVLLPMQANIWTPGNRYNIQTDWSYKKFPQDTYGLGGVNNTIEKGYQIDYSHLRFYQTIFKTIGKDLFAGVGYYMDHFWDVHEIDVPPGVTTDFENYGIKETSTSSGFTLNLLYDLRRNLINPQGGWYANVVYRENLKAIGSDENWSSLLVDVRKYFRFPRRSQNVLGIWSYNVITLSGKPPYLALPFTGCDTYINSGRGYIQGRFRGQNMAYAEAEYRFGITRNGFLGGVLFANCQSFSEPTNNKFQVIWPAFGGGLRFKLNKFSNTNVCIDYGFGVGGSQGVFVNLGEVF